MRNGTRFGAYVPRAQRRIPSGARQNTTVVCSILYSLFAQVCSCNCPPQPPRLTPGKRNAARSCLRYQRGEFRHIFRTIGEACCHWFFTGCVSCADFCLWFTVWNGARTNRGSLKDELETLPQKQELALATSRPVRAPKRGDMFD